MLRPVLWLALTVVIAAGPGAAQDQPPPGFDNLRVPTPLRPRAAKAVLSRIPNEPPDRFQERIRKAARAGPDFAGHYVIVQWPDGDRVNGAIVDVWTLKIYPLPFGPVSDCWHHKQGMLQYWLRSRLLVIQGFPVNHIPRTVDRWGSAPVPCGTYLYSWNGAETKFILCSLGVPPLVVTISGRVVDADRNPMLHLPLRLVAAHNPNIGRLVRPLEFGIETGGDGRFSTTHDADRYEIEVDFLGSRVKLLERIDGEGGGHIELGDIVDSAVLSPPPPAQLPPVLFDPAILGPPQPPPVKQD